MINWMKYVKQEELVDLQIGLDKDPWVPPTKDQVDRMLKEIRTAQSERAAVQNREKKQ